ncbi:MAG: hypothetical protein R3Y64_08270 [Peptostreptococcaceae bacterium]
MFIGFTGMILNVIAKGVKTSDEVRVDEYDFMIEHLNKGYLEDCIIEILKIKREGIDFRPMLDINLNPKQLRQVGDGLLKKVNVDIYSKSYFSHNQMREIKDGLVEELDVFEYALPSYDVDKMRFIKNKLLSKRDKEIIKDKHVIII